MAHCVYGIRSTEAITKPLIKDMQGGQFFRLANMSVIPVPQWEKYEQDMMDTWETKRGFSFGYAAVELAPSLLYEASKVPGIVETVPEKLRGVYWMKGNLLPEVLATFQYGKWEEKEKMLLLPNTPWTWAWWGGQRHQYPGDLDFISRVAYTAISGKAIAESYTEESSLHTVLSLDFSPCPAGAHCEEGSRHQAFANLMSHPDGDLSQHGMAYVDGYSMEEMDASEVTNPKQRAGARYFRRAELFCGLFGRGTGYELLKIIDKDGEPIEPYYGEYAEWMRDRPLIVWSGVPESMFPASKERLPDAAREL